MARTVAQTGGERLIRRLRANRRRQAAAAARPSGVSGRKLSNSGSGSLQNSCLKAASPTPRSNVVSPRSQHMRTRLNSSSWPGLSCASSLRIIELKIPLNRPLPTSPP